MPPADLRFGGGGTESLLNPLTVVWLLVAIGLIFVLPRNKVITPFLLAFFTIPPQQVVVLGGVHFYVLRILVLAGLARRAFFQRDAGELKFPYGFNWIDKVVILWSVTAVVAFFLEFPGMPAVIQGLGDLIDTLGAYLVIRAFIPDGETVRRTVKTLAILCAILGVCMINEQISHFNVFSLLGGPGGVTVRNGKIRSAATMGCLYAGAFSGVLVPLFVWLWKEKEAKKIAALGLLGAAAMVITSNSSTSQLALGGALLGLAFWRLRHKMRVIRWTLACTLIALHLYMKAPVWALIARIDLTGSSSSWQRFYIVDMTVRHFGDWWLIGTPQYINWGWGSWDLCNQFVAVALTGGLIPLIFYIMIFVRSFSAIGKARKLAQGNKRQEWLLWCVGSTLLGTVVAHFGINYMAQLIMGFFVLIACISVVSSETKKTAIRATVRVTRTPKASHAMAS